MVLERFASCVLERKMAPTNIKNASQIGHEIYEKTKQISCSQKVMLKSENGATNGTEKGTNNHQKSLKSNREKQQENRHLRGEAKGGKRTKKPGSPGQITSIY